MGQMSSTMQSIQTVIHIIAIAVPIACGVCVCGCLWYKVRKMKRTFTQEKHEKRSENLQKAALAVQLQQKRELSALVSKLSEMHASNPPGPPMGYGYPTPYGQPQMQVGGPQQYGGYYPQTQTGGFSHAHRSDPDMPLDQRIRNEHDQGVQAALLYTQVFGEHDRVIAKLAEASDPTAARKIH